MTKAKSVSKKAKKVVASTFLAVLDPATEGRQRARRLFVFDDAVVAVKGSQLGGRLSSSFGAVGVLAGAALSRRRAPKKQANVSEQAEVGPEALARSDPKGRLIRVSEVQSASLRRTLVGDSRLLLQLQDGTKLDYRWNVSIPKDVAAGALTKALGSKLTIEDRKLIR